MNPKSPTAATLLAALGLLIIFSLASWQTMSAPAPVALEPTLSGEVEFCLTCHQDLPEISGSHPVDAFGCVSCHGGERLALDAELAHSTLRGGRNPSALSVVEASCGGADCHSGNSETDQDHIQRVLTSVQATYAGAITTVRYSFGAQPGQGAVMGIEAVQDGEIATPTGVSQLAAFDPSQETHPSVQAFGANCLNCHLHADPLDGPDYAREKGCAACHTVNAPEAAAGTPVHQLTTALPYSQCNACHNRGNYSLRSMTFEPRPDEPADRLHDYYQPIAQFTRCEYTLDCIDCHTRAEAMGDGDIHSYQAEVEYVRCKTCHGTMAERPVTQTLTEQDELAFRLAFLNPVIDLQAGDTILVTERGEPLWNTRWLPDGAYELYGKVSGQPFRFRAVMDTDCEQAADEQESRYCHACHAVER